MKGEPLLLLVSMRVVEFLERLPRKQKTLIRKTIAEIESDPSGVADHLDHDSIGRMVHIKIIGEYAIVYWVDHADRHIKILDIHSID